MDPIRGDQRGTTRSQKSQTQMLQCRGKEVAGSGSRRRLAVGRNRGRRIARTGGDVGRRAVTQREGAAEGVEK